MSQDCGNSSNRLLHRNSKVNCCLDGCHNAYYNTDLSVKFYGFPNKWYEKERRKIWIDIVKRICSQDNKEQWQPKSHDKICSAHFVGNRKRDEIQDPSYNPTIFPENYQRTCTSSANCKKERYKKLLNKSAAKQDQRCSTLVPENESALPTLLPIPMETEKSKQDFCCQTSLNDFDVQDDSFVFESTYFYYGSSCEVAVQCHIPSCELKNVKIGNSDDCNLLEIKLEQEELIIKDEPEEVREDCSSFVTNLLEMSPAETIKNVFDDNKINIDNSESLLIKDEVMDTNPSIGNLVAEGDKDFVQKNTLKKPFKCSVCDKAFTQKRSLQAHVLIHTGRKRFKCNRCGKSFSCNNHFKRHIFNHNGVKESFKCSQCDKTFNRKGKFINHIFSHKGEKCKHCDKQGICRKCQFRNTHVNS